MNSATWSAIALFVVIGVSLAVSLYCAIAVWWWTWQDWRRERR